MLRCRTPLRHRSGSAAHTVMRGSAHVAVEATRCLNCLGGGGGGGVGFRALAARAPSTASWGGHRLLHAGWDPPPAPNGCLIEAPWLVNGGHGASLRQPFGSPPPPLPRQLDGRRRPGPRLQRQLLIGGILCVHSPPERLHAQPPPLGAVAAAASCGGILKA
jgi:hypothetical protein